MAKKLKINKKSVQRPKLETIEDSLYKTPVETNVETKAVAKAETVQETKVVPKVEPKAVSKVVPRAETVQETKPVPKVETKRKGAEGYRENVERTMLSLDASDVEYIKAYAWEQGITVNGAIREIITQWSKKRSIKASLPATKEAWISRKA